MMAWQGMKRLSLLGDIDGKASFPHMCLAMRDSPNESPRNMTCGEAR
jgi:hypothetical protein